MSLTVWKYTWPGAVDLASFEIPRGAEILHVHEQHDKICFWARVNPAAGMETRTLRLSGTGHDAPSGNYLGSAHMQGGAFVFHLFEDARGIWKENLMPRKSIREAKSISCGACDFCPAVHVNFLDELGEVFATASVPAEIGEQFIADFRRCMSELTQRHSAPVRRQ